MVAPNEALRDPRTGLLCDAVGLLRVIAARKGPRGALEADRDIAALARVVLFLHDLIVPGANPQTAAAAARTVARTDPGWKPLTHWRTAKAQEEGPEPTLAEDLEQAARDDRPAHAKKARPSAFLDAIGTILGSVADRWWEAREIAEALVQVGAVASLDSELVSRALTKHHRARGWERRRHPRDQHRWQYHAMAAAPAAGGKP